MGMAGLEMAADVVLLRVRSLSGAAVGEAALGLVVFQVAQLQWRFLFWL